MWKCFQFWVIMSEKEDKRKKSSSKKFKEKWQKV